MNQGDRKGLEVLFSEVLERQEATTSRSKQATYNFVNGKGTQYFSTFSVRKEDKARIVIQMEGKEAR